MAFIIPKKAMGLGDAGVRSALARVSEKWPRNSAGDFVFEKGLQLEHLSAIMNATPRGLHLLAKHGYIPMTEGQAVKAIFDSGYTFEPERVPVARVQRLEPSTSVMLLLLRRGYRHRVKPKTAEPVKVVRI